MDNNEDVEHMLEIMSLEAFPLKCCTEHLPKTFCHVVEHYTVHLYGKRHITKWLNNNRGCTYLDMITLSDIAYVVSLFKNNMEYWPEQHRMKKMSPEEKQKYKAENDLKKPKFTQRAGQTRALYSSGWSKEGLDFYYDTLDKWKEVGSNREVWEELEAHWAVFSKKVGFDDQWKKRKNCAKKTLTLPPLEEDPRARFSLADSDDVFSWKKNPRRVSDENEYARTSSTTSSLQEDGNDESEEGDELVDPQDSDESEESDNEQVPTRKKPKLQRKLNYDSESDSEDDY